MFNDDNSRGNLTLVKQCGFCDICRELVNPLYVVSCGVPVLVVISYLLSLLLANQSPYANL